MESERKDLEIPRKSFLRRILKAVPAKYIILILLVAAVSVSCTIGLTSGFSTDTKVTKLGFEDIGELATQAAYCSVIINIDDPRKIWGVDVPLTHSKFIYSYDYVIKAGFSFSEISWNADETTVYVYLPTTQILSQSPVKDSLKVFLEEENIFSPITMQEQEKAEQEGLDDAIQKAIDNGLFENATTNAKTILTGFIGQVYSPDEYAIKFFDKESGKEI